jgi:hypothetical protein
MKQSSAFRSIGPAPVSPSGLMDDATAERVAHDIVDLYDKLFF